MTVAEMIKLLESAPQEATLNVEGCCGGGCWIAPDSAAVDRDDGRVVVVLFDKERTVLQVREEGFA